MQVQSISYNQNFQGRVYIVGDLSAVPARLVRKSASTLKSLLLDKPYDLFIKQNHKENTVSIIAMDRKNVGKNKAIKSTLEIDKNADLYDISTLYVMEDYEKKMKNLPLTFGEKCKKFFNNLGQKFMNAVQDKDEI